MSIPPCARSSGERDRETMDALLTSPLHSHDILFAKWLGSFLSVRWFWFWPGLIWAIGIVTEALHPLAIPMLSGPGAFATVMMLMTRAHTIGERAVLMGAIAANAALTFVVLLGAGIAERRLGKTGMNVLHRVMGLLLASIAVQFVVDGAHEVLPGVIAKLSP